MEQEIADATQKLDSILANNVDMADYCKSYPKFSAEMLRIYEVDYTDDGNLIYTGGFFDEYYDVNTDTYDLDKLFLLYLKFYTRKNIDCQNRQLTSIPVLPKVIELNCSRNQLITLPKVLPELVQLICYENFLESLGMYPKLTKLQCKKNKLTELQLYPDLYNLDCEDNKLKSLPEGMDKLERLYCSHNKLKHLPKLRKLSTLYCEGNNLVSLSGILSRNVVQSCDNYLLEQLKTSRLNPKPARPAQSSSKSNFESESLPKYTPVDIETATDASKKLSFFKRCFW